MQDRLKFRYFNKYANKMVEPKNWQNVDGMYECIKQQVCFDEDIPPIPYDHIGRNGLVFMQCTGLKDKNGKLIYEGDILDLYVSSKKLYRYEVKYEIGSFMLVSQDEIFDFPNVWNDNVYPLSQLYYEYQNEEDCIDECEIIGNIYENPELLKDGE
jgi:uncharacterized phage protein (TIGR01671 family)